VQIVVIFLCKTVQSMGRISSSLNVSFVVALPNGSVGEIPISVSPAIKNSVMEIM